MNRIALMASTGLVLGLAGCGGSDGSGTPTASMDANIPTAATTISSSDGGTNGNGRIVAEEVLMGGDLATEGTVVAVASTATPRSLFDLAASAARPFFPDTATPTGLTQSGTEQCDFGGSVSAPASITPDSNFELDAYGNIIATDYPLTATATLQFFDCNLGSDMGLPILSGDMNLSISSSNGADLSAALWGNGFGYVIPNLGIYVGTSAYSFSFEYDGIDTISYAADYTLHSNSPDINGTVTVTTITPWSFTAGTAYPTAGQVEVVGADGTSLVITATAATSLPDDPAAYPFYVQVDADPVIDGYEDSFFVSPAIYWDSATYLTPPW